MRPNYKYPLRLPHLKDVNIFIDEICFGGNILDDSIQLEKDLKALTEICAKLDPTSYLWMTIARLVDNTASVSTMFNSWLMEKEWNEEFFVPYLLYPLRNSKEIVSYEACMEKGISNIRLPTQIGTQMAVIPTNLTVGIEPITINYEASQPLNYNVQKCFQVLPTPRVLIIMVIGDTNISQLINAIKEVRGQMPLILKQKDSNNIGVKEWLVDESNLQDLIVDRRHIGGFEWPSVLLISQNHEDGVKFWERNGMMRAMSRLVWLNGVTGVCQ